jgi:hypothetical protein
MFDRVPTISNRTGRDTTGLGQGRNKQPAHEDDHRLMPRHREKVDRWPRVPEPAEPKTDHVLEAEIRRHRGEWGG